MGWGEGGPQREEVRFTWNHVTAQKNNRLSERNLKVLRSRKTGQKYLLGNIHVFLSSEGQNGNCN